MITRILDFNENNVKRKCAKRLDNQLENLHCIKAGRKTGSRKYNFCQNKLGFV